MATPDRQPTGKQRIELLSELVARGSRRSFLEVASALEQIWPDAPALGGLGPVGHERLRLRPTVGLAFPAGDIDSIDLDEGGNRVLLTTTFFGLYGADTPLPPAFADHMARTYSEPRGERVRAFLDIYHHRFLSLLLRAFRKYRIVSVPKRDRLLNRLNALAGRTPDAENEASLGLPADAPVRVWRTQTAHGLAALLSRHFGARVRVRQLAPRSAAVPKEERSRLGRKSTSLGETFMLGARVRDRNRLRATVNARDFAHYNSLVRGGVSHKRGRRAVESYLASPIDVDLDVQINRQHIRPWQLGKRPQCIGRHIWLGKPKTQTTEARFGLLRV